MGLFDALKSFDTPTKQDPIALNTRDKLGKTKEPLEERCMLGNRTSTKDGYLNRNDKLN